MNEIKNQIIIKLVVDEIFKKNEFFIIF